MEQEAASLYRILPCCLPSVFIYSSPQMEVDPSFLRGRVPVLFWSFRLNQVQKSLSRVLLFATPWTIQPMEFSRPEYWSGQQFPSPGGLPNPGIKPRPPTLQAYSLPLSHQEAHQIDIYLYKPVIRKIQILIITYQVEMKVEGNGNSFKENQEFKKNIRKG